MICWWCLNSPVQCPHGGLRAAVRTAVQHQYRPGPIFTSVRNAPSAPEARSRGAATFDSLGCQPEGPIARIPGAAQRRHLIASGVNPRARSPESRSRGAVSSDSLGCQPEDPDRPNPASRGAATCGDCWVRAACRRSATGRAFLDLTTGLHPQLSDVVALWLRGYWNQRLLSVVLWRG